MALHQAIFVVRARACVCVWRATGALQRCAGEPAPNRGLSKATRTCWGGRRVQPARTEEYPESCWFNVFVLHQNRVQRGASAKNTVREQDLAKFLDLVVWGHEHDCIPDTTVRLPLIMIKKQSSLWGGISLSISQRSHPITNVPFVAELLVRMYPLQYSRLCVVQHPHGVCLSTQNRNGRLTTSVGLPCRNCN